MMQIEIVIKKSSNFFTLKTYPGNDIGTIQVFDTQGRGKIQNRIQIGKPQDNGSKSRTLRLQDKIWDTNENTRKLIFFATKYILRFIYLRVQGRYGVPYVHLLLSATVLYKTTDTK
jgi:hypothetical protein